MRRRDWWPLVLPVLVLAASGDGYALGLIADAGHLLLAAIGVWIAKSNGGVLLLGQAAFMATGAYAYALTAVYPLPPLAAVATGIAAACVCAVVFSPSVVRRPAQGAALATLALVIVVQGLATGLRGFTGGATGITGIPPLAHSPLGCALLAWTIVAAACCLCPLFLGSGPGRAIRAVRDDASAAARAGIDPESARRLALCVAAGLGGLAGTLSVAGIGFISPDMFGIPLSISLLAMVVIGGEAHIGGPIAGALFIYALPELIQGARHLQPLVQGLLLLLVIVRFPGGFAGIIPAVIKRRRKEASP